MNSGGRLLLAEIVLPKGDAPYPGKLLDMVMLALTGGEKGTASQYRALLDAAGIRMTRVVPTASLASIVGVSARRNSTGANPNPNERKTWIDRAPGPANRKRVGEPANGPMSRLRAETTMSLRQTARPS
jgi:hypothetical protein